MKVIWVAVAGAFLLTGITWGESSGMGQSAETKAKEVQPDDYVGMSLQQCIEAALIHSPDLAAAQQNAGAAWALHDEVAAARWPWLDVVGSLRHYNDDQRLVMPRSPTDAGVFGSDIATLGLNLQVPLYTSGRIKNTVAAADQAAQSAAHQVDQTDRQLVFDIKRLFYRILAQAQVVASLDQSIKALERHRSFVQHAIEVQKAARVDLMRVEVRVADLKQQRIAAENGRILLLDALAERMGIADRAETFSVVGAMTLTPLSIDPNEGLSRALSHRPDVRALEAAVRAGQRRLDAARGEHGPSLGLEGNVGWRYSADPTVHPSGTDDVEDVAYVGLGLKMPLFQGGGISARVRRAKAEWLVLKQRLRQLKLRVRVDVRSAAFSITAARERVQATQTAVDQAVESLRIEQNQYRAGRGSITNVLDAQAALLGVETHHIAALSDYNTAIAQWHLALGSVGKPDLASSGPLSVWLHPAASTIKPTSPASPSLPGEKMAHSWADDGVSPQSLGDKL
jgi:outer membrane protein